MEHLGPLANLLSAFSLVSRQTAKYSPLLLSLAAMSKPFTQPVLNEMPRRPAFEHRKTDEGYNSCSEDDDQNHTFEKCEGERQSQYKSANDREIPIVRSTRTMYVYPPSLI